MICKVCLNDGTTILLNDFDSVTFSYDQWGVDICEVQCGRESYNGYCYHVAESGAERKQLGGDIEFVYLFESVDQLRTPDMGYKCWDIKNGSRWPVVSWGE